MAKAALKVVPTEVSPEKELQKIIAFYKEEGAFGFLEIEIEKEKLFKFGNVAAKSEADIFPIFLSNLTKKARDIFGI